MKLLHLTLVHAARPFTRPERDPYLPLLSERPVRIATSASDPMSTRFGWLLSYLLAGCFWAGVVVLFITKPHFVAAAWPWVVGLGFFVAVPVIGFVLRND